LKIKQKKKPKYPYYGVCDNEFVVLFTSECSGFVVDVVTDDSHYEIGHHSYSWCERVFKPFIGTITIE
jgi:hypothetical protein